MSLSVRVDRVQSGKFTQVIGTLSSRFVANADPIAGDMTNRWRGYTYDGWPVGPDRPGHIHSRDTIEAPSKLGNGHYQFRITAPYAGIIEFGGYRLGPKTSQEGGETLPGGIPINPGIYAIQRPSAPLRRAESRVKLEMAEILGTQLVRGIR